MKYLFCFVCALLGHTMRAEEWRQSAHFFRTWVRDVKCSRCGGQGYGEAVVSRIKPLDILGEPI